MAKLFAESDFFPFRENLLIFKLVKLEYARDKIAEPFGSRLKPLSVFCTLFVGQAFALKYCRIAVYNGKGGFYLVRNI